mmetsp:Transcript_44793/g.124131  ORF Transcript_44793/g.124131 Transcript_44793/m.124131 type:complete len:237 (-) Transcript_44793:749-1459(-)
MRLPSWSCAPRSCNRGHKVRLWRVHGALRQLLLRAFVHDDCDEGIDQQGEYHVTRWPDHRWRFDLPGHVGRGHARHPAEHLLPQCRRNRVVFRHDGNARWRVYGLLDLRAPHGAGKSVEHRGGFVGHVPRLVLLRLLLCHDALRELVVGPRCTRRGSVHRVLPKRSAVCLQDCLHQGFFRGSLFRIPRHADTDAQAGHPDEGCDPLCHGCRGPVYGCVHDATLTTCQQQHFDFGEH